MTSVAGLKAFDAAARLGSFAEAADALGLTPSAISHQIRALEREIGTALFVRQGRAVVLSEAGTILAPYVRQGFVAFERGVAALHGRTRARQIKVSGLALFNQTILIPRLADFTARWPDYDVHIEATSRYVNFDQEDVDVAIRAGDGDWPGVTATELLRIAGLPVALPGFIAAQHLKAPDDLRRVRLIHHGAQPEAWSQWLKNQGITDRDDSRDLWFDSAPAMLQAAEQGLGVAMGIDPLVRRWPGFGERLVPVFPECGSLQSRYWLVHRRESGSDPKIKAFASWVRSACRMEQETRDR